MGGVERGVLLVGKGGLLLDEVFNEKGALGPPTFEVPKRPRRFMMARLGKAARMAFAWGLFIIAGLFRRLVMGRLEEASELDGRLLGV